MEVLGLEHDQAIEVVKETPASVMIVVCRQTSPDTREGEEEGEEEEGGMEEATMAVELKKDLGL